MDRGEGPDYFHLLMGSHAGGQPVLKAGGALLAPPRTTQQEAAEGGPGGTHYYEVRRRERTRAGLSILYKLSHGE